MGALKNHPGMWLRDDAAAAINAMEDKHGVIRINRAGQTEAQQQAVIDQWDRGDRAGLFEPKRPARLSDHVRDGGIGLDVYNYTDDRAKLVDAGFVWYGPKDPVHYTWMGKQAVPNAPTVAHEYNPFGIAYSAGLQKIARFGGYTGNIDQQFGAGSMAGFARWLRANWGYRGNDELGPVMWAAIARWLRARWGYVGNDTPGPVMRAALQRAETANYRAL